MDTIYGYIYINTYKIVPTIKCINHFLDFNIRIYKMYNLGTTYTKNDSNTVS